MQRLIYLLRHGEIETSVPRRFVGRSDLPLSSSGIRQAQVLGEQFRSMSFARVVTSPLQRAVQTAVLVSGWTVDMMEQNGAFAEIDLGDWEGRTVMEIEHLFPGAYEERGRNLEHYRPCRGESFGDVAARALPALEALLTGREQGPILIVAHAGVNRVLLSRLLQRPVQQLFKIPQDYGAINILQVRAQGVEVLAVNLCKQIPTSEDQ
ncbi:histidine phosphatase family protein [Desulfobulbus oligotrophicus]|uniref:Histidine phosphatase family protein n=1 Tax=Desulfobulbus oligotrophicus TaxID=1909699 RepID=A0A7T6APV3_9BACT|nr:histidine phosphatase family protein [Desulfobulbus oligotrophicus]QQG65061.1 histidine phosphatase family protein [Desulfobulbus oligotrophicus]